MKNLTEMQLFFHKQRLEECERVLSENIILINNFMDYCKTKQVNLSRNNFEYVEKIGILANYPKIVNLLNNKVSEDKEQLIEVSILESEFKKPIFEAGYYSTDNYIVMAHSYFRRGHNANNNFAPSFINEFSCLRKPNITKYLAIDNDRVRIDVDSSVCREYDTWYGSKFVNKIGDIEDGIVKLRPPLDIGESYIEYWFGNTYSLDIKWTTKNGIRVFQAEEFKEANSRIKNNNSEFHPVKYIHAEFDISKGIFRHFDGAIHFYTEQEYYQRRENDFNYNNKNNLQLKTLSQKLFKINGEVTTEEWINLVSHYLSGNPLVHEYFEGSLRDDLVEKISLIRANRNENHST